MTETTTFHTRIVPPGALAPLLLRASTAGVAVALVGTVVALPLFLLAPVVLLAVVFVVVRRVARAEYEVNATGLTERTTPLLGGAWQSRTWAWPDMLSYTLDREPTRTLGLRNVLLVRLPGHLIRLREPHDPAARDEFARFVDRFVGHATGDAPRAPRKPLTSSEVPQLRRTLANQPAFRPQIPLQPPFLSTGTGRVVAAVGALAIVGLSVAAVLLGATLGNWFSLVFILLPGAVWLGWRALGGGGSE
jgi:hypothetical protein